MTAFSVPKLAEILAIAVALSMDAFAVSVASGATIRQMRIRHAITIAGWFGFFQALMPILGWWAGVAALKWVAKIDHWVVFGLLTFLGCKMIYEAYRIREVEKRTDPLNVPVLFSLALATSIDALGVGISFAMLRTAILTPALIIGGVTFVICFGGVYLGERGKRVLDRKIEIAGGLILIGIGVKILIEHFLKGA